MKHRLVELLQCIRCQGSLDLTVEETREIERPSKPQFSCQQYCSLDRTATIPSEARCAECSRIEVMKGTLLCRQCGQTFHVIESVPWLFVTLSGESGNILHDTVALYSHIWAKLEPPAPGSPAHIDDVEAALGQSVIQGRIGLDAGSGSGNDTAIMAHRHPDVEVVSLDMSEGVYNTAGRMAGLANVHVVRASVLSIPLKSGLCDFGYSFGVLHHTTDPLRGLREIARVLKDGGGISLYLYEDHADNPWKAVPLKLITALRLVTTRMNPRLLSGLCYLLSPFVVIAFSIPARIFNGFERTRPLAAKMPFNFGTSLFSVHGDLVDRFGAPVEVRYSRESLFALFKACRLQETHVTKIRTLAGWVARGIKTGAQC